MIEITNLQKTFEDSDLTVLKDISLKIEHGDIYGLVGRSGAGKSTLLRCINGLTGYQGGSLKVDGCEVKELSGLRLREFRKNIGMIFQQFSLLERKTVYDNVALPMECWGWPKQKRDQKVKELLELVGLKEKLYVKPRTLSGGQKQRVAIARALTMDPKILLCDEATSALDPKTTNSILDLLLKINKELKITIVIVTHQMSVVRKICSHVAIMKSGEIVETGSVSEIFSHPKSDVARELIRKDEGDDISRAESSGNTKDLIQSGRKVRIVFSENSAFQPVIANMILKFREPVNILRADTRNIGGVAKGEMILEFAGDSRQAEEMQNYLKTCGIELEEVTDDVE